MFVSISFFRSDRAFRLKRFDSFVVFKALEESADALGGSFSYEDVASALNRAGLTTRRGGSFTARVVRTCLKEIEAAGLIELTACEGGFRLKVVRDPYKGATLFTKTETETETETDGAKEPREDAFEAGLAARSFGVSPTQTETVTETETVAPCININTQEIEINKRAREGRASRKNTKYENTEYGAGDLDDAVSSVDISDDASQELRRALVRVVWEPSLRPDLIDRAVAAVKLGLARASELLGYARRAVEIARKTSKTIWQTFTLDVKRAFNLAGYEWTPTRPGREPAPRV